jgi:hypothetical protein
MQVQKINNFAFIQFDSIDQAKEAKDALNGQKVSCGVCGHLVV